MAINAFPTDTEGELKLVREKCKEYGVKPAFEGYYGYPFATCCSVNEQVVHGFPNQRPLVEGDIVSVDMGVVYDGFVGDAARTFMVGEVAEDVRKLLRVTEEGLYIGIQQAHAGNNVYDIGAAIQNMWKAKASMWSGDSLAMELAQKCMKNRKCQISDPKCPACHCIMAW